MGGLRAGKGPGESNPVDWGLEVGEALTLRRELAAQVGSGWVQAAFWRARGQKHSGGPLEVPKTWTHSVPGIL